MRSFFLTTALVTFLVGLLFSQVSFAGGGFTEQGNKLSEALYNELIKKRVCTDNHACFDALQMYGADSKRIYLSMYGQKNMLFASEVVTFLIEKGLKITDGMPITLKVFPAPQSYYLGFFKGLFGNNDEVMKLELNK